MKIKTFCHKLHGLEGKTYKEYLKEYDQQINSFLSEKKVIDLQLTIIPIKDKESKFDRIITIFYE